MATFRAAATGATFLGGSAVGEVLLPASMLGAVDLNPQPETELVVPTAFGVVGSLQHDGTAVALSSSGTPSCSGNTIRSDVASALRNTVWLSAAEPAGTDTGWLSRALAVTLSPDGRSVADVLFDRDGELALASRSHDYDGLLGDVPASTPPPRIDAVGTFSRTAGGAFILGGQNASGAALGDVWFKPLGGSWLELSTAPEHLGNPLAGTYAFGDDRLWIVEDIDDETAPPRERRRARLLRVDPAGGGAERVFYVPRKKPGLRPFLSVDRDGGVLLALADDDRFTLLRLEAHAGTVTVGRARSEKGKLVRAPIVDDNGYSFVVEEGDGSLRIIRRRVLVPVACNDDRTDDAGASHGPHPPPCDRVGIERLF